MEAGPRTSNQRKRVLIVDDEPAGRDQLREVIDEFDQLQLVAELQDGSSAVAAIREQAPDIVFLDIDMPGLSGLDVAAETADLNYQLIFVTAHHHYALQAFDTHAIDYLLKPVRPSTLEKCIWKILRQENLAFESVWPQKTNSDCLVLSDGSSSRVVQHADILLIEGIGRYRRIHLTKAGIASHQINTIISDTTLDDFEIQLQKASFMRVHRSYIVNLELALELRNEDRRLLLRLEGYSDILPVARSRAALLKQKISQSQKSVPVDLPR